MERSALPLGMSVEAYERMTAPIRRRDHGPAIFAAAQKGLTLLYYGAYALLVALLAIAHDPLLARALIVPGISFILVSLVRALLDFPRPYEEIAIDPLVKKDTLGKSFPSRHVFSCFVISQCWVAYVPAVGFVLLALGVVMAIMRVLGGVHYPRDVVVGALVGIAFGLVGLWVIP